MVNGRKSSNAVLKLIRKNARKHGYTVGLTSHAGDMSWKVTRSNEESLEAIFGQGWMDK